MEQKLSLLRNLVSLIVSLLLRLVRGTHPTQSPKFY
jgi:hypothetical protein